MTVAELIRELQSLPQDLEVNLDTPSARFTVTGASWTEDEPEVVYIEGEM